MTTGVERCGGREGLAMQLLSPAHVCHHPVVPRALAVFSEEWEWTMSGSGWGQASLGCIPPSTVAGPGQSRPQTQMQVQAMQAALNFTATVSGGLPPALCHGVGQQEWQ